MPLARRQRRRVPAVTTAGVAALACCLAVAATQAQSPLTTLDYRVVGIQLRVSPPAPAFPKGVPGSVAVDVVLGDGSQTDATRAFANGAMVEAVLRGPSFPARRVIGRPNEPLLLPPLNLVGDYQLDDIRLVDTATGAVRLEGAPRSVPIRVFDEVLVSRVTSRPLTLNEIRDKGIVIDEQNFRAVEFEVGFVLDGKTIPVRFPVVAPAFRQSTEIIPRAELEEMLAEADAINQQLTVDLPPALRGANLNIEIKGINFQIVDAGDQELALQIPSIPALMMIPGNIGFLNQFFSVQIFTSNAAPGGSGLSVRNVEATLVLPPGPDRLPGTFDLPGDDPLRFARTGANAVINNVLPIVQPGADGELGTADDVPRLQPGETGQAEFLVEGLREGLHVMDVDLVATLDGLAAGSVQIQGKASGSVLVRNPSFSLAFSHPRTVRAGEPYTASATILNTSSSVANLVSVTLPRTSISGAVLESSETVSLGSIHPGESATAVFLLRSQRTGGITFSNLSSDAGVSVGQFQLRMGVDERGVPLSPDSIGYPSFVDDLPPNVLAAADRVLGQALSIATAGQLPAGVLGVSRATITRRVLELAEAGQRFRYGDGASRVLADLLLDWQGGRATDAGFDQILRATDAGREFREALMRGLEQAEPLDATARLATRASDLAGRGEAWFLAASDRAAVHVGLNAGSSVVSLDRSAVVGAAAYRGTQGHWLAARTTEGAAIRWSTTTAIPQTQLSLLAVGADGTGRLVSWSATDLPNGACLVHEPSTGGSDLLVDDQCDGSAERTIAGTLGPVAENPPSVLAVLQDITVESARPNPKLCLIPEYKNYGNVLAVLFSKPMRQEDVNIPGAYVLNSGNAANAVQIQPSGRVALINLQAPVGALRPRSLSVNGVRDARGNALAASTVPVQMTADDGIAIAGRVAHGSGAPAVNVPVTLTMYDQVDNGLAGCTTTVIRTAQMFSDASGRFSFDFVLADVPYSVSATDTTGLSAGAVSAILDASTDTGVARDRLSGALATALQQLLGETSLPDAVATAEGLDRALLRDLVPEDSARVGTEVPVALRFRGRGTVVATVLDANGTTPVAGAAVNLFPDPDSRELGRGLVSDANGRVAFFGVPLGLYSIEASTSSGVTRTVAGAIETPGQVDDLPIVLSTTPEPRTELRGQVLEADNVTPHGGGRVFIGRYLPNGVFGNVVAAVTAGTDGFWSAPSIPVGTWDVVAISLDGRRKGDRRNVSAAAGSANFIAIPLQGRATVVGRVEFANGAPAVNAIVAGGEALVRTDAAGLFTLTGVPTGPQQISAGLERNPAAGIDFPRIGSASVDVVGGSDNFVVVRLVPQGRITGRVLDANGQPVPNMKVAMPVGVDGFFWVDADAEGRYVFDGVDLGRHVVSAPAPATALTDTSGLASQIVNASSADQLRAAMEEAFAIFVGARDPFLNPEPFNPIAWGFERLEVAFDGQTVVADIRFLPAGTISGTVLNDQGVPIGARVRLTGIGPTATGDVGFLVRGDLNSDPALGTFSFVDQALAGPFGLQAASPFFSTIPTHSDVTSRESQDRSGIVLRFQPAALTKGRLTGTVLGPDGQPVGEGVLVKINFSDDYVITTDTAGRFDTQFDLPAKEYLVEAEDTATGLRGRSQVEVKAGTITDATVRLLAKGALQVDVRQANQQPAAGAAVTVTQGSFPFDRFDGVTDAIGRLTLDNVFEGLYAVSARFVTGTTTVQGRTSATVTREQTALAVVTLAATGTIRGVFLEADQRTPVPFAQIAVGSVGFATTDEQGRFSVPGLPLATYTLTANEPVSGRLATATATVSADGQILDVQLVERPVGEIVGAVISSFRTGFVAGAHVTLSSLDRPAPSRTVTTGPDGTFRFPGTPAGRYQLTAVDSVTGTRGAASGTLPDTASTFTIDVALDALASIAGTVLEPDGTTPAANATVTLGSVSVDTDAAGRVAFDRVLLGSHVVTARSRVPGATRSLAQATVAIATHGPAPDFTIRLPGVGTVNGRVLASDSVTPVPGAEVRLVSDTPLLRGDVETVLADAQGRYSIPDVAVGGFRLTAVAQALASTQSGSIGGNGDQQTIDLVLGPSGTVRGRLVQSDQTTAVPSVDVLLTFTAPSGLPGRAVTRTGADGTFELRQIPVGPAALEAIATSLAGIARLETRVDANGHIVDLGNVALDQNDPAVVQVSPAHTAAGVPIATPVLLTFNEPLAPPSVVPSGVYLRSVAGAVPATVALLSHPSTGDLRVVQITPATPLASLTTYEVVVIDGERLNAVGEVIGRGPRDRVGRPLVRPFISQFTTADQDPPDVLSFTPAHGAEQVDPASVVRLSFDEAIRSEGVTVTVRDGAGTVIPGLSTVGLNGRILVFTPTSPLAVNRVFTAAVDGVRDLAGNPAAGQPLSATFTTLDTLGPTIAQLRIAGGVEPIANSTVSIEAALAAAESGVRVRLTVDGVAAGESAAGVLALPIALPGQGTIVVRAIAIDRHGNHGPFAELPIAIRANQPPQVAFARVTPATGPVPTGGEFVVEVSASDDSGVSELRAVVGGAATLPLQTSNGAPLVLRAIVPAAAPASSVITITAEAIDSSGRSSGPQTLELPLRDATGPSVTVLSPAANALHDPGTTFNVLVRATDATGVASITLEASGAVVSSETRQFNPPATLASTTFEITVPASATAPQQVLLFARAADASGNTAGSGVPVRVTDTVAPVMGTLVTTNGVTRVVAGQTFTVRADATDNVGVSVFDFSAEGAATTSGSVPVSPAASPGQAQFAIVVPADAPNGSIVTVRARARDAAGRASSDATLAVTVGDTAPPAISMSTPLEGTIVTPGQTITVETSATDDVGVSRIVVRARGAVTFDETRTFTPVIPSAQATFIVPTAAETSAGPIAITVQAIDAAGNQSAEVTRTVTVRDTTPPAVTVTSPNSGTSIDPRSPVSVTVQATDAVGVAEIGLTASGLSSQAETRAVSPPQAARTESFTLTFAQLPVEGGSLTLSGTARDSAGNQGLSAPVTVAVRDVVAPAVVSVAPADGATNIDPAASVTIAFTEPMDRSSLTSAAVRLTAGGITVPVTLAIAADDRSVTLAPQTALAVNTVFTVIVDATASDRGANGLAAPFTSTFRTLSPDTTAPKVQAFDPANGEVGVGTTEPIAVSFTEPIDPASVTAASFRVSVDNAPVAGAFSFADGGATVRFTPAAELAFDAVVVVELTGDIRDLSSNALVNADGSAITTPITSLYVTGRFAIVSPDGDAVVERSAVTLEARGASSLSVASVVFTVNGTALPAVTSQPFARAITAPAASTSATLTVVASARDAGGVEIARAERVYAVLHALRLTPTVLGLPRGGTGRLRFEVSEPLAVDLTISLAASNDSVAIANGATVVLPAGARAADVAIAACATCPSDPPSRVGAAVGNAAVVATSARGTAVAIVSVSDPVAGQNLTALSAPIGLGIALPPSAGQVITTAGRQAAVVVALRSTPAPGDIPVSVTSSNPAVATATASAIVAGEQVTTLDITTGVDGSAVLTLRAGDVVRSVTVIVGTPAPNQTPIALAQPVGLSIALPPSAGQVVTSAGRQASVVTALLPAPAAADVPVSVTSSNTDVATATASPIAAGERVTTLAITTGADGTATLTLRAGDVVRSMTIIVGTPAPSQTPMALALPVGISLPRTPFIGQAFAPLGAQVTLGLVLLPEPAAEARTVSVTSSDPAVAQPASATVTIAAGSRIAPIELTTGTGGRATLTLELDGLRRDFTVLVGEAPTPANTPVTTAAPVGISVVPSAGIGRLVAPAGNPITATLGVQLLRAPRAADVVVTVTTSDPNVVSVGAGSSTTVVIPAGSQVVPLTIGTFGNEGAALISFEFEGQRLDALVVVGNPPASQRPAVVSPVIGVQVEP